MLFLGLDLAWGQKNTSGGVILRGDGVSRATVVDVQEALGDDDEILNWVERWDESEGRRGLLIGVDAPLLVPNETGRRPCEGELARRFAKYQAGGHPANRRLYGGRVRGEILVARLAAMNVAHNPLLTSARLPDVRAVMEVFPHPAHIVLFGLTRTLKYKAKPGRYYPSRWAALNEYARLLRTLTAHDPPLALPAAWPPADMSGIIGGRLKQIEDGLDALSCAYIAYWYWWHGAGGAEVIGDMADGYIVVPRLFAPDGGYGPQA
ncbi:MAG: DUF429 domain-containing protein [Armatimonadota bacterium]|nr:DUF429 domain-containing protein [Armatimonadota bacterium]